MKKHTLFTTMRAIAACLAVAVLLSACAKDSRDDETPTGPELPANAVFTVKTGVVHYDFGDGETGAITFDEYGVQFRTDMWNSSGGHSIAIYDGVNRLHYTCENGQWQTGVWDDSMLSEAVAWEYDDKAAAFLELPGIVEVAGRTIAGKDCRVIAGERSWGEWMLLAGWGGIIFEHEVDEESEDGGFVATLYRESAPVGAFEQNIHIFN